MKRTQPSENAVRDLMCDIGRRMWVRGFVAGTDGNISYRLDADRILCTPSGVSKGSLRPDQLCIVSPDGKLISGKSKPTSEIRLHLTIFREREDIRAVVHAHPPHATAWAVSGVDLPTGIYPEAEVCLGVVRTAKYVMPGDQRLGDSILAYVHDSSSIILQSHGTVSYDVDLESAYRQLEMLDAYAHIAILARQIGSLRKLTKSEMSEVLAFKSRAGLRDPRLPSPSSSGRGPG